MSRHANLKHIVNEETQGYGYYNEYNYDNYYGEENAYGDEELPKPKGGKKKKKVAA